MSALLKATFAMLSLSCLLIVVGGFALEHRVSTIERSAMLCSRPLPPPVPQLRTQLADGAN